MPILDLLNEYSSLVSVVAIAALSAYFTWRDSRDKKIKKLEKDNADLKEEALKLKHEEERKEMEDRIKALEDTQKELVKSIHGIEHRLEEAILLSKEDREIIEELAENTENNHKQIKEINKQLDSIFDMIEKQNESISHISTNLINCMQYTKALADVVTTLAEAMRDNHINGNVTAAIAKFKESENKLFDAMCENTRETGASKPKTRRTKKTQQPTE